MQLLESLNFQMHEIDFFVILNNQMDEFSVKILIVEDDLVFGLELQMLLEELGYYVIGKADNGVNALKLIQKEAPDLILMDVELKGAMTGLDIAHRIKHLMIPILFITSRMDEPTYNTAQKSNMIGYLTKPIGKFSLRSSIMLAISNAHNLLKNKDTEHKLNTDEHIITKNCFFFKQQDVYKKVLTRDIAYVKSQRNYCDIFAISGKTFVARIPISKLEEMLPAHFMTVHRQYLVNLQMVDSFSAKKEVLQIGITEIPVSKANRKLLLQRLNIVS